MAVKAAGVTRITINPQTLRDDVLRAIGRRHTVEQFYQAFDLARRCGHDNINTDLIAGLTGDDPDGFAETLDGILGLSPESVTVHTLSMKRASRLVTDRDAGGPDAGEGAAAMVAHSAVRAAGAGYRPYYLYRQSRTADQSGKRGMGQTGTGGPLQRLYHGRNPHHPRLRRGGCDQAQGAGRRVSGTHFQL